MNLEHYIRILKEYVCKEYLEGNDGASVLSMLYMCYADSNRMDDEKIRADFDALYQSMNGMSLQEVDRVIYPVCTLCRDHEKVGFIHGVQIGIRLLHELMANEK